LFWTVLLSIQSIFVYGFLRFSLLKPLTG